MKLTYEAMPSVSVILKLYKNNISQLFLMWRSRQNKDALDRRHMANEYWELKILCEQFSHYSGAEL